MPIYEFYCRDCHTVYNFRARRVDTTTRPACPRCSRPELERRISVVAFSRGRAAGDDSGGDADGPDPFAGMDPGKMEKALESLMQDGEGLDDSDPRQAAHVMRRFLDATGLERGPAIEEAIRRMESGEDSESIEHDLGDALEAESEAMLPGAGGSGVLKSLQRQLPPKKDDKLYDL